MDDQTKALTNRSLRTIRSELEFLTDTSLLTPHQLSSILALLPPPNTFIPSSNTSLQLPIGSTTQGRTQPALPFRNNSATSPTPIQQPTPVPQPTPVQQPIPVYNPPSYSLATATALYAYSPTDTGDLTLSPNDPISITEYMNADWAKGRNDTTGQEGIFPRAYIKILSENEKAGDAAGGFGLPPQRTPGGGYGNVPLEVSQQGGGGGGGAGAGGQSKFDENGKKFGKKLGNAAIFGAGATIGGKIVNGIF
ncbi:MAG: hypothetical protein MMC33_003716 [Icmadophila ericetorum]|nr:hypothetical protein [Icmadophila ericetorum]